VDDSEIEEYADDAMSVLDDVVKDDWSVQDTITFFEFMESNIEFRLKGLRADAE
jgi:hypothetical protein